MKSITCAISKLPILKGEEMVCLPLECSNSYSFKKNMKLKTKGMSVYVQDSFRPLGLIIRGVAGEENVFSEIHKDGNTKSLEEYFELPIESIVNILTQKEEQIDLEEDNQEEKVLDELDGLDEMEKFMMKMMEKEPKDKNLKSVIAIFIKRSIFDYIMKRPDAEELIQGFEGCYDELQEKLSEWNKEKQTLNEKEQFFSKNNPFGRFSGSWTNKLEIFSRYLVRDRLKEIYETALVMNTIRDSFVQTFSFIHFIEAYLPYEFLPSMKGKNEESIHEKLAEVTIQVLEKIVEETVYEKEE